MGFSRLSTIKSVRETTETNQKLCGTAFCPGTAPLRQQDTSLFGYQENRCLFDMLQKPLASGLSVTPECRYLHWLLTRF